jgi:hypothetical protein
MTIKVGFIRRWKLPPDIVRQTPGRSGVWENIRLVEPPEGPCDYIVILNRPAEPMTVLCPPENVWAIIDEPPNELSRHWHRGFAAYRRIFTQDFSLRGARYVLSHPALPWLVDKDYDFLIDCPVPEKSKPLSWVTSNRNDTGGHRLRMRFLEKLRQGIDLDLYGRGFQPMQDKWDGLAPYRYSIAVENFHTPYYWTEKIADCFLAWTMPLYAGSSRIEQFFPKEALVRIDIRDPQAIEQVRETIASDRWQRNLDAIAEARRLVLNRYQLFPFLAQQIAAKEACSGALRALPQPIKLPARTPPLRFLWMLARRGLFHLVRDHPRWRTYELE